jgi:hypothetical protein
VAAAAGRGSVEPPGVATSLTNVELAQHLDCAVGTIDELRFDFAGAAVARVFCLRRVIDELSASASDTHHGGSVELSGSYGSLQSTLVDDRRKRVRRRD